MLGNLPDVELHFGEEDLREGGADPQQAIVLLRLHHIKCIIHLRN